MRMLPTVIVCALGTAVSAAALLVEQRWPSAPDAAAAGTMPLFEAGRIDPDRITRIGLARGGDTAMAFDRTTDRGGNPVWSQVEPFDHPMQSHSMRQLVVQAAALRVVDQFSPESLTSGVTLSTLGLDPPRAVVTYEMDDEQVELRLGRRGIAGRAYVQVVGRDDVFVVNHDLHDRAVDMDPRDWRDRTIFQDVGTHSDLIVMTAGAGSTVLERDRRTWRMLQPYPSRLDDLARDELLAAVGRAKSMGFILDEPEDLVRFGLTDPAAMVSITTTVPVERHGETVNEPMTQVLLLGGNIGVGSNDRFGMVEGRPAVFRVSQAVWQALVRPATALVARTGSGVTQADVRTIRIQSDAGDLTIERDLERWIAPELGGREIAG